MACCGKRRRWRAEAEFHLSGLNAGVAHTVPSPILSRLNAEVAHTVLEQGQPGVL